MVISWLKYAEPSGNAAAWDYCEKKSRSIEIVFKNEETDDESLARIHFIMDDEVGNKDTSLG